MTFIFFSKSLTIYSRLRYNVKNNHVTSRASAAKLVLLSSRASHFNGDIRSVTITTQAQQLLHGLNNFSRLFDVSGVSPLAYKQHQYVDDLITYADVTLKTPVQASLRLACRLRMQ